MNNVYVVTVKDKSNQCAANRIIGVADSMKTARMLITKNNQSPLVYPALMKYTIEKWNITDSTYGMASL